MTTNMMIQAQIRAPAKAAPAPVNLLAAPREVWERAIYDAAMARRR